MTAPALEFKGVGHAYDGVPVLSEIDLAIAPAEVLSLVGPSGCGKSTLLRLAAGLEPLSNGSIQIAGQLVSGKGVQVPPEDRRLGFVFQDIALFPHLTVTENVAFGLRRIGVPVRRQRVLAALEQLDLAGFADAYPHTLSGGQQQRVALARALAPDPKLMLLDEPFSGLDARLRDRLRDETLDLLKAGGVAAMIVTHDPEEAMRMGDRLAVMSEGRIVQCGTPSELYRHPASAFVAGFLGEVERFVGRVDRGSIVTPLGAVPAPGLAEGCAALALIRPEGVVLEAASAAGLPRAHVVDARLLGRTSLIRFWLDGLPTPLHSRMPGDFLPEPGAAVSVRLDCRRAHVFPLESVPVSADAAASPQPPGPDPG
ncbi:MAG TPA: ABC transporter ATP-binding protein [Alphaproteobacteria bacterium]|nr:ABC transporter ATP-binding protein [Alphaproteobacteria bacterium]